MNMFSNMLFRRYIITALVLAVLSLAGCTEVNPSLTPTAVSTPSSPTDEPPPTPTPEGAVVDMTLSAHRAVTQYSPRPEPFTQPSSLDDIAPPLAESWQTIAPESSVAFQNYDNLRVAEEGEALLDLGGFMRLLFKRDTVAQFTDPQLAADKFVQINVDTENTPLLQRLVLSLHLLRGGFAGELLVNSEPVALTTPNAVVLVSGTTFFLAYDPEADRTWVGNFGGGIDVGDEPAGAETALDSQQLVVIPPIAGRSIWALPPELSFDSFGRLVDTIGSPIDAARILGGPNVSPLVDPGLDIYHGPGRELERLGVLPRGSIATILRQGLGQDGEAYWQITCPAALEAPRRGCWVSADPALTAAYNIEGMGLLDSITLVEPTGNCTAATDLPRYLYASDITLRWQGTVELSSSDYFSLRVGPVGGLLILGTFDPVALQTAPGQWAYTIPAGILYRPGTETYQWQVYKAAAEGVVIAQSAASCFQIEPPPATVTPIPDSDVDGWPDNVDQCPFLSAGLRSNPLRPGCPLLDSDDDGWYDDVDMCPFLSAYPYPDPIRHGCPGPTPTPTDTPTPFDTPSATNTPTETPTPSHTPTLSDTPTPTDTPLPSGMPTWTPTIVVPTVPTPTTEVPAP